MIPKKLSRLLFIPAVSLGLNTGIASAHAAQPTETANPPHLEKTSIRDMVVPGKMTDANTIQINTADLAKLQQPDAIRIVTLTDKQGHKQRFVLLTPIRSQLGEELMESGGSLKEFQLYPVVDENGNRLSLLASKRIVSAPANQITVLFDSPEAAESFFTTARQQLLAAESIVFANLQAQEITSTEYANEINKITSQIAIHGQDNHKSSIVEPIELFPARSVVVHHALLDASSSGTTAQ